MCSSDLLTLVFPDFILFKIFANVEAMLVTGTLFLLAKHLFTCLQIICVYCFVKCFSNPCLYFSIGFFVIFLLVHEQQFSVLMKVMMMRYIYIYPNASISYLNAVAV